jgi:FkbM family methyltransferase
MQFTYESKSFDIEGVSQDDHIYRTICRTGTFYEIDMLEYIYRTKHLIYKKGFKNVVIDIGANIGNHSVFLCSFLADHLIAIEPNPKVLARLRRNLSQNASNYTLMECAVGDKTSRGTIVVPENVSDNIGSARVDANTDTGDIDILTVDSILSSWKDKGEESIAVPLIKIDVEGMEPEVLKGSENTILEFKPHIFAEAATRQDFQKISKFLRPFGYRKMPGHWASTPVYHFAYNPAPALFSAAYYWQVKRAARRINSRLRQLTGR